MIGCIKATKYFEFSNVMKKMRMRIVEV